MLLLAKVKDVAPIATLSKLSILRYGARNNTPAKANRSHTTGVQQQSHGGRLPPEIVQLIYAFVIPDMQTLASCARTCRAWSDSTVELLYTDVRPSSEVACELLARTLEAGSTNDLARRVKSLRLPGPDSTNERRKTFPSSFARILRRTYNLTKLSVRVQASDDPVDMLGQLFDAARGCPLLRSLTITFNRRAGFHDAMWSLDGILRVLAHYALRHLTSLSLSNFLFSYGHNLPKKEAKKTMPPIANLRLRNIFAFGSLDDPISALLYALRGSLNCVDLQLGNRALTSDKTFEPVAGRMTRLRFDGGALGEPSFARLTALTHLRVRLHVLTSIAPSDIPPLLHTLVIDQQILKLTTLAGSSHPLMVLWRYLGQVAPVVGQLKQMVVCIAAKESQKELVRAAAFYWAVEGDKIGLQVQTRLEFAGGRFDRVPRWPDPPVGRLL